MDDKNTYGVKIIYRYVVEEIFSSIRKNRPALSDSEYVALMYDECSVEEMKALRYREFNGGADL